LLHLALVSVAALHLADTAGAQIVRLQPRAGGVSATSYAVSGNGRVIAGTADQNAVRWIGASAVPSSLPGNMSVWTGWGLNSDGSVMVGTMNVPSPGGSYLHAYRWTALTGRVDLKAWGDGNYSYAYDVSDDGQVVVGYSDSAVSALSQAVIWRWPSAAMPIGPFPNQLYSRAYGVSADGLAVAGHIQYIGNDSRAFRWTEAGGLQLLGIGEGRGISADGSAVVGYLLLVPGDVRRGFRWTALEGTVELPPLPGDKDSYANATSESGGIVVGMSKVPDSSRAVVWRRGLPAINLNTHLSGLSGWVLYEAVGVSDDGRVVTGTGAFNGQPCSWVAQLLFCRSDLNGDDTVDDRDFLAFAASYDEVECSARSMPARCTSDLNSDGLVDDADFVLFAQDYGVGACP
jgi:uncharacterized membrane protein